MEAADVNQRIAGRVRQLRAERGLSLEALAGRSGVSRSMISLIERGSSSPTAVVLEKLATGLGVMLASLFEPGAGAAAAPEGPLSRRGEQLEWRDPGSGYRRRNVSPGGVSAGGVSAAGVSAAGVSAGGVSAAGASRNGAPPVQIVEVHFPAGARVAFETGARDARVHQQVWLLEGSLEVTLGDERYRLHEGDCLAMQLDRPIVFHNPTRQQARYAVVIASEPISRR